MYLLTEIIYNMAKSKKIPQILTEKEFKTLICNYIDFSKRRLSLMEQFARIRNVIVFSICFYMGFRPKEAKNIKVDDLSLAQKEVYISAENNKQRNQDTYPVPEILIPMIRDYLKIRKNEKIESEWLFPSLRNLNKPIYRGTLIRAFERAITQSKFKRISYVDKQGNKRRNLSIYSLRHSFGTKAMHKLKDIKQVARVMRHYDPQCRSTYVYIHTDNMRSRKQMIEQIWK